MRDQLAHLRTWHIDVPTMLLTLLIVPIVVSVIGILRKHGKLWSGFLVEGGCYWVGRVVMRSLAVRFALKRYCRLQLQKDNQYLHVPSRSEVKLEIDRVFINLALEPQSDATGHYDQRTIFSAGNRIRVIGDPGSGKSSLVKRVFRDACFAAIYEPAKTRLPILVELKNLVVPKTTANQKLGEWFYNYLREATKKTDIYGMQDCFDNCARMSGLLVLLDGLDEVATAGYERVQSAILALSERLSDLSDENVIILTMRTQLHQQVKDAFRDNFGKALFVKPFTPSDIFDFLSVWPFSDRQIGTTIYTELTDRPTLREMCTNPLVLAMYVAERQTGADPIIPESRTDFYKKVLEELLVKRRMRQTGTTAASGKLREQRERILGKLAYDHLLDPSQPANSLLWNEAIKVVRGVMACDAAKAEDIFLGIAKDTGLVSEEKERESFRFTHLTFCEFLAAYEAVEGQKDGLERLIAMHREFRNAQELQGPSRLLEVIPFACGLVHRSRRGEAISGIAELADERLLARCFLETKTYESIIWKDFVEHTRNALLNTPESDWDEKWLRDLHLFNVVVRDAAQCAAHLPVVPVQINLGEFYETLVRGQKGKSLATLLSAYASHDAQAAFRLADVGGLDLPRDFPEIVVSNCDQEPFGSLAVTKMLADANRLMLWALPLAEAALSSHLVAMSLRLYFPDNGIVKARLQKLPKARRWDIVGLTHNSLYTQIITLACNADVKSGRLSSVFPRVEILRQAIPPGALGWWRFVYSRSFPLQLFVVVLLLEISKIAYRKMLGVSGRELFFSFFSVVHHGILRDMLWTTPIVFLAYWVLLRGKAIRMYYANLINLFSDIEHPRSMGKSLPSILRRLQLRPITTTSSASRFVFYSGLSYLSYLFTKPAERALLSRMMDLQRRPRAES